MKSVLRALLLFVNVCAVLLAAVTVTGRVLVTWVDDFEPRINEMLDQRNIQLRELSASWHGLNPILTAASVRFPGGYAERMTFEFDLIETVLNGAIVARHLNVDALEMMVVRTAEGRWTLAGADPAGAGGFDAMPLLLASDNLAVRRFDIAVARESDSASEPRQVLLRLEGHARVVNERPRHEGDILVAVLPEVSESAPTCAGCELKVRWQLEGGFGIDLDGFVTLDGDGFEVPVDAARTLGLGGARFETLRGRWTVAGGDGGGTLLVKARDIGLPRGSLDAVDLALEARSSLWHTDWFARINSLDVRAGADATSLSGIAVALRSGLTGSVLEFDSGSIDLAPQVPIVRSALSGVPVAVEWIDALAPRGRIDRISGRFDLGDLELSATAELSEAAVEHYKGVPMLRNTRAKIVGNERGFLAHVDARDMTLGLMDIYEAPTILDEVRGDVQLWFKDKFVVVHGEDIEAKFGGTRARGAFSVSRPEEKPEQRISVWVTTDSIDALDARAFVPKKLSPRIIEWLDQGVIAGIVEDARVVFYGHIRAEEGLPMRQAEIAFRVDGGAVRFHEDWPIAAALDAQVSITMAGVDAWLDRGMIRGIALDSGRLTSPRSGEYIDIEGRGAGSGESALDLIEDSPLAQTLSFIRPDWQLDGPLTYSMAMRVPIKQDAGTELSVDLDVQLDGVTADLGSVGLTFSDLVGPVSYRYPHAVTSAGVRGRLFGRPAKFDARFEGGRIALGIDGSADVVDVGNWLAVDPRGMVTGEFDFTGEFSVWPGTERAPRVAVRSDLDGVGVELPAPLYKEPAAARPAHVEVELRDDGLFVGGGADRQIGFWARIPNEGAVAAHIGINAPLPAEDPTLEKIVVTGALDSLVLDDWIGRFGRSLGADLDTVTRGEHALELSVIDFAIASARYREAVFESVVANVDLGPEGVGVAVVSPGIEGELLLPAAGVVSLDLKRLSLPAGDPESDTDPLADIDPSFITTAEVKVSEIAVGDQAYGAWQFKIARDASVLVVDDLSGQFRGLDIATDAPLRWHFEGDARTEFKGSVSGENLATVLPAFGYAPSVETESVAAKVDLVWPGSPLNFDLARLKGMVNVEAKEGRFVDVESGSGAMRVFSLLNFTTIAKRMALDFSDVFGKGISFDEVTAGVAMDGGNIRFVDPMVIDGSGAYFRVGGQVDFLSGALDNEMVVTLPVSSSLPWYAAYLSFINPIAAGAVLVGERLFRNQIDQFSSATYKVTGTLEDPKVEFVRVFGRGPTATPAAQPDVTNGPATPAETQKSAAETTEEPT